MHNRQHITLTKSRNQENWKLLDIRNIQKQLTVPYDPRVKAYRFIINIIRTAETKLHKLRFGKYGIYNFQEKVSSDDFSPSTYIHRKLSVIRIYLVNAFRTTYKAVKQIQALITKIQVTYPPNSPPRTQGR